MEGVRVALTDGAAHAVDSSELAFKLACQYAFRDAYAKASPTVLEPIMAVEVSSSYSVILGPMLFHMYSRVLLTQSAVVAMQSSKLHAWQPSTGLASF